jgi:tRNA threonylcarbamoyladenosine biosynthesis protein TsaE
MEPENNMAGDEFVLQSNSEMQTLEIGRQIASAISKIHSGIVIGLQGTLGAGKTRLVQAIGKAWGVDDRNIISPTFTICTSHEISDEAGTRFHHIDAYRIADDDQWDELGFDELIDQQAIVFIEWAEKFAHRLPPDRIDIEIKVVDQSKRSLAIRGFGPQSLAVVELLRSDA